MSMARSFLQLQQSPKAPPRPLQSLPGFCWQGGRQPFVGSLGSCVGLLQMPMW
jgi:hypothetical protein